MLATALLALLTSIAAEAEAATPPGCSAGAAAPTSRPRPLPASPQDPPPAPPPLAPRDVFGLEFAADPRIAPDGARVVYERHSFDVQRDVARSDLWIVTAEDHRPLTSGDRNDSAPRWSPDGRRIAYVSGGDGPTQLCVRWMDTGQTARLTQTEESPSTPVWSPDGRSVAFTMFVAEDVAPFAKLPAAPEHAEWAPLPRVVTQLHYRQDGEGYLRQGHRQLFVVPADGGTPRQVTNGAFGVEGDASWTPDGSELVFASNRRADADLEPLDTEIWAVAIADGGLRQLTDRRGPDHSPVVSPDGSQVAYVGFDDRHQGYQVTQLLVVPVAGGEPRVLTPDLDRSVRSPAWAPDGKSVAFLYDDHGDTRIGRVAPGSDVVEVASWVGGESLGRPYEAGAFSIAADGRLAFTGTSTERPADVFVGDLAGGPSSPWTRLNDDLLAERTLGKVEEIRFRSSFDQRPLQGWIVRPPGFDPAKQFPLILEIHGGPFANYGPRFSVEMQLYAAAGYVVLYMNPRGSTSYGEEFGNLIHHAYPGNDYDDLMSGVDAVIARGSIDPQQLYVTGGSGGGVLTAWIVGKTDRFRAAVVAKPVINWASFVLTADESAFFTKYWFPAPPWEDPQGYFARSPLSLVGNVVTPTMVMTGEADYRTPISESEQYFQALALRRIDTALVRIPGAGHGITARPSRLAVKTAYVLEWFARHRG